MKTLSSFFFSVCILRLIRPCTIKHHLMQENFIEFSEIHWENMFYPYICSYCSSLVYVSPWELR